MRHQAAVTPETALLRVLIAGERDEQGLIRKIKDWTEGQLVLDGPAFAKAVRELESSGLIERRPAVIDKRTGEPHVTFALTTAGRSSAVEILAASLTRKP
jgi:DNA-binding HxlR family transcriptional regulator